MAYFFFKTVKDEKGSVRVRPLPGQSTSAGVPIMTSLNVQCAQQIRQDYPLGTVFGSSICELRSSTVKNFYSAGDLYPMGLENRDYKDSRHIPTAEMKKAYNEYLLSNQEKSLFDEPQPVQTNLPETLLQQIESEARYAIPTIKKDGFFIKERDWKLIVRNIIRKKNTLLTGPSGTGKTLSSSTRCLSLKILFEPEIMASRRISPENKIKHSLYWRMNKIFRLN